MSAQGGFFITPHAVKRCQLRVRGGSYEEVRDWLIERCGNANFQKIEPDGTELWRARSNNQRHRFRFRVRRGEGELPAVVTVIAAWDQGGGA